MDKYNITFSNPPKVMQVGNNNVMIVRNGEDMCSCGRNPKSEAHTCPFSEEIDNDYAHTCTCCAECTSACAREI